MQIKTTSILVDDEGRAIEEGTTVTMITGRRSVIGRFVGIKSASMLSFENPITGEKFNIRLSSISEMKRCSFKVEG